MPSFDIVIEVERQEVDNAINQAQKELQQRYDFRGSKSKIDWNKEDTITLVGDDDYKLKAVTEIIHSKLIKRNVSINNLKESTPESASEGTLKKTITLQQGIPSDKAKEITKIIKASKIKVQPQVQEEQVRVTGKKLDDLQQIIALIKAAELGLDFQFTNFRD